MTPLSVIQLDVIERQHMVEIDGGRVGLLDDENAAEAPLELFADAAGQGRACR
jgi:hypothetical protein